MHGAVVGPVELQAAAGRREQDRRERRRRRVANRRRRDMATRTSRRDVTHTGQLTGSSAAPVGERRAAASEPTSGCSDERTQRGRGRAGERRLRRSPPRWRAPRPSAPAGGRSAARPVRGARRAVSTRHTVSTTASGSSAGTSAPLRTLTTSRVGRPAGQGGGQRHRHRLVAAGGDVGVVALTFTDLGEVAAVAFVVRGAPQPAPRRPGPAQRRRRRPPAAVADVLAAGAPGARTPASASSWA